MSNNPFLEFSKEELEAFRPLLEKLKKKYDVLGIEIDFYRVYEEKPPDLVNARQALMNMRTSLVIGDKGEALFNLTFVLDGII